MTLTRVKLVRIDKRVEYWIRFGRIAENTAIDRQHRVVGFAPGSIFTFVRSIANEHGTVLSRIHILRAVAPGERCATVPFVGHGADILLRSIGWPKVERVLQAIDAVEALGIDAADAAPDHWHHIHNRLSVNETPRVYTRARHQAWLKRRKILPCPLVSTSRP